MSRVELQHGAATDVGRVREVNEDAFLAAPPLFVVADGMGGHEGGDVASGIVVEEFARLAEEGYDPHRARESVTLALRASQARIREYAADQLARGVSGHRSAGTTAVVAILEDLDGPRWLVANVGDSRAYRFADGVLEQVSVDHSVVQELVDAGTLRPADVATHPERHVITRALGDPAGAEPDFFELSLPEAERLLLCSDGITEMIDDATVAEILARNGDPRDAADELVRAAVEAGGRDNATAVVVDVVGSDTADDDSDRDRDRDRLEQKLGARP